MIEPFLKDDAFLADVAATPLSPSILHFWWLGQSGYLVKWNGVRFLIDPYLSDSLTTKYANTEKPHVRMTSRVVDPSRLKDISFVTASHVHTDHLDAETLQAVRGFGDPAWRVYDSSEYTPPALVAPYLIRRLAEERSQHLPLYPLTDHESCTLAGGVGVYAIPAAHGQVDRDPVHGYCPYLGYVFTVGPFTLYHSGDTVVYDGMADELRGRNVDVAFLPINGKVGNMNGADAARLAHDIGAKLVVPCHYDMFEFNTASPEELFIPECERLGQPYKVLRAGERLTLTK